MILAQLITGANPSTEIVPISVLDKFALGIIYWCLGTMASFCTGVGIGAIVGACRSLFMLFSSKTAWFAIYTFLLVAYLSYFLALGILPIAGNLGDITAYKMQALMFVGAVFPGLLLWGFPIALLAVGSGELARTQHFRSYAALYSKLIYYACFIFAFYLVLSYLTQSLSPKIVVLLLLAFPATYIVIPFVMLFKSGIWLPIALQYGGLIAANLVLAFHKPSERELEVQ